MQQNKSCYKRDSDFVVIFKASLILEHLEDE